MLLFTSFLQLQDILHLGANISVQKKQTPFFFFPTADARMRIICYFAVCTAEAISHDLL